MIKMNLNLSYWNVFNYTRRSNWKQLISFEKKIYVIMSAFFDKLIDELQLFNYISSNRPQFWY